MARNDSPAEDEWLKQLVAAEPTFLPPTADVAERVLDELRSLERSTERDWLTPALVTFAALAASWLVWLAVPAWAQLSTPPLALPDRLLVAFEALL